MSTTEFVTTARIDGGTLTLVNAKALATFCLSQRDGDYAVRVEPLKAARSQAQNRAYWLLCVGTVSEHTGYSPEEIHAIFKSLFLPKHLAVTDGNGEVVGEFVLGGSTTKLTKEQFAEYMKRIQIWSAETLGCYIPDPNEP